MARVILGERDRERIETAELEVQGLGEQLSEWKRRAKLAEGAIADAERVVSEHVAYSARVEAWASDLAGDAGRQVVEFSDQAAVLGARLTTLTTTLRELHTELANPDGAICRHCGFTWPCPSIAAVPS